MGLFRSDFFRSMAAGFVLGALGLAAAIGPSGPLSDPLALPAVAAPADRT